LPYIISVSVRIYVVILHLAMLSVLCFQTCVHVLYLH